MVDASERNPFWPELSQIADEATKALGELSKTVSEGLKPPAGAYAFFNTSSHALTRVGDCKEILRRLCRQKVQLIDNRNVEHRLMPEDWPPNTPYPKDVQEVMSEGSALTRNMQIDLESLYMFGMTLLDQWALQVVDATGIEIRRAHPFVELMNHFQDDGEDAAGVWENLKEEMIWLHYNLRFYRNRFINHVTRPWQRGTTTGVIRFDFNLHTPTPPGWLDDDELNKEILALAPLIENDVHREQLCERPGALLEHLFKGIDCLENREDREAVASLFAKKGGSTPSYEIVGRRLLTLVARGTTLTNEFVKENLERVRLGEPALTSDERWARYQAKKKGD